jgi:AraC-like DNA-binding protein
MQFQEYLGASPTEIIKIVRLNRFLNVLHKHKEQKLTRLALEAGYYDQSHLIRDFKNFSNMSPGNYKRSYPLISKVMNHL